MFSVSIIISGVIFLASFIWAYFFFNYPTLDDIARAYSFIHAFVKKDVYIYQLDTSYHGALINGIVYYIFFKIFGINILSWRISNSFMLALASAVALSYLKRNQQKVIFAILMIFSDIAFRRNILLGGDYAIIPLLTFSTILLPPFIRGISAGLGLSTNPLFIFLLPIALYKNSKKKFLTGFLIGLTPLLIFNAYNVIINLNLANLSDFKLPLPPTLADMLIRYKEVISSETIKTRGFHIYTLFVLLLISILMLKNSKFLNFNFVVSYLIYFYSSLIEERYSLFFYCLSFLTIADSFPYLTEKKEIGEENKASTIVRKITQAVFLLLIVLFVYSSLFSLSSDKNPCISYLQFPYSHKHCSKFDYKPIIKDVLCLKDYLEKNNLDYKEFGGDVLSTGLIKFFNPSANIYYLFNPWTYFIPREFNGETKLRFSIEYYGLSYPPPREEYDLGFIRRSIDICNFKIRAYYPPMTREEIQKGIFGKSYVRESGIKEILSHILQNYRK
ncbi:hypothetical protein HRbin19_00459 [bacterium HR19]|nr:hypothetical protein HRbin19_00459 [bacterium HR19]